MHYSIKYLLISVLFVQLVDASQFRARTFPTYPGLTEEKDLLMACLKGDLEKVKVHIKNRTRLDCTSSSLLDHWIKDYDMTPLMLAAERQYKSIIKVHYHVFRA